MIQECLNRRLPIYTDLLGLETVACQSRVMCETVSVLMALRARLYRAIGV